MILLARTPYLGAGAAIARVFRRRLPLVVRIVERMPSTAQRVYQARGLARGLEWTEGFVLRRASLVIPMAEFTRSVATRAGVPPERIVELPILPRWGTTEVPSPETNGSLRVVCAARLERLKGVDVLIRAFAVVIKEIPDATLEIAGDGPERGMLEETARRLGLADRVRFRGWLSGPAMPTFFSSAQVAVLSSRVEEGHPMALREAALAGCALIGTDLGGIRDIVRRDHTGILVPPEDERALAQAIRRLLGDPGEARRLGETARAEALEYFDQRDDALARVRERIHALASR